jgi:hypothetical protein
MPTVPKPIKESAISAPGNSGRAPVAVAQEARLPSPQPKPMVPANRATRGALRIQNGIAGLW